MSTPHEIKSCAAKAECGAIPMIRRLVPTKSPQSTSPTTYVASTTIASTVSACSETSELGQVAERDHSDVALVGVEASERHARARRTRIARAASSSRKHSEQRTRKTAAVSFLAGVESSSPKSSLSALRAVGSERPLAAVTGRGGRCAGSVSERRAWSGSGSGWRFPSVTASLSVRRGPCRAG
jgi:hypothetical protein